MAYEESVISNHASRIQIIKDLISSSISGLTGQMFFFGMGLMLLNQTHSPLSFGLSMIIDPLISLFCMVPIGNLVDSRAHKPLLISSFIIRIIGLIVLKFTINWFTHDWLFLPIVIFMIVDAFSTNLNSTTYTASLHELVNKNHIQRFYSLSQMVTSSISILAPILGIVLYNWFGFHGFINVSIGSCIIALLILLSMHFYPLTRDTTDEDQQSIGQWTKFKSAWHYVKQNPVILISIGIGIIFNFFFASLTLGPPYIIREQLHYSNGLISVLETSMAVGMLVGGALANFIPEKLSLKIRFGVPLVVITIIYFLYGVLLGITPSRILLMIAGSGLVLLLMVMLTIINILIMVLVQNTVKTGMLGRVQSILYTGCTSILPCGILIYTFIFDNVANGGLVIAGSAILLGIILSVALPKMFKRI